MNTSKSLHTKSILEINLISAQQLVSSKKSYRIQTYVVAYLDYDEKSKLLSRIDELGSRNPTWNDKFIFCVDSALLNATSCIVFEIYKVGRKLFQKDKRIGVVRVLLEDLIHGGGSNHKFMAFHVRNRSDIPQGILNIGVVTFNGICEQVMSRLLGSNSGIDYRNFLGGSGGL
ncbi:Calcium-dependent lipid-binding domain-containing protein [Melia azedarach]|uniref:Calcium-dependent lipid-binding domain-containing protein n=1 Tax=Melia azedarach TaxID=155640 RepID=A0ACC1XYL5_MELAZ|nr:Calcium-dependent lipid-binding domain-containing protein [Melia azedarach]